MFPRLRLLLLVFLLAACSPTSSPASPNLTVFAAASLSLPFEEIGDQFTADHPGLNITFNFAGSQQLAQQLNQGAPCDLFASASLSYMAQAVAYGRVNPDGWQVFAHNQLVAIYNLERPLSSLNLHALSQPGLRLVLAAPEVPVGMYTQHFLDQAALNPAFGPAFQQGLLANLASYENNVKVVLAKVSLGEADAGIVYTSDLTDQSAPNVGQIPIPPELNVTASYPIAVISDSTQPELAQALLDYILSPIGQDILASFGFLPPVP